VDEVSEILARKDAETQQQMEMAKAMQMANEEPTEEPTEGEVE
jgi:hypothetical protein